MDKKKDHFILGLGVLFCFVLFCFLSFQNRFRRFSKNQYRKELYGENESIESNFILTKNIFQLLV